MKDTTYAIHRDGTRLTGCIDLVESHDDGGWYAHEYDFQRKDHATRTSAKIYASLGLLRAALDKGEHQWGGWD